MKSYSAIEVFSQREQELRDAAETIVLGLPDRRPPGADWLRCHEIARVVGRLLHLEVQDGLYGLVDHSWCRIPRNLASERSMFIETYSILDVYAVGRLPQVQLVSDVVGLREYKLREPRTDIDTALVDRLSFLRRSVVDDRSPH